MYITTRRVISPIWNSKRTHDTVEASPCKNETRSQSLDSDECRQLSLRPRGITGFSLFLLRMTKNTPLRTVVKLNDIRINLFLVFMLNSLLLQY